MIDSLMAPSGEFFYHELSFSEFTNQYKNSMPKARLFELSLPWLTATEAFMLPESSQVLVHCLYQSSEGQEPVLNIAWPLVHSTHINKKSQSDKQQITSLTSFYSAVAEPIFFSSPNKESVGKLLTYIQQHHQWHSMQLGAFEEGLVSQALLEFFPYQGVFSSTDNVYQTGISDYASYYQQRPSQLRNTITRREKKLSKTHQFRIEIITELSSFPSAFSAYKAIYQQSWKGDEFSFDFIEQVSLAALQENKLRLGVLFVDDEPAAAQLWFLQTSHNDSGHSQTTASIFKLAYAPKYQMYSVGSILSLALFEHVISQDQVEAIEFGMGSEAYKQDWLSAKRTRQSYQIFNQHSIYGKLAIIRHFVLPRLIKIFTRKS